MGIEVGLGAGLLGSAGLGLLGGAMQAGAQKSAAQQQADAATRESERLQQMFNLINAQQAPYRQAGYSSLNQILGGLTGAQPTFDAQGNITGTTPGSGFFTRMPTAEDIQSMPGYQFGVQQGTGAARQAMNVMGGGSNVDRAAQKFAIDYTLGSALPQYMSQRRDIYNTLASIAGLGQTGTQQTGQAGMQTAGNLAQLGVGAAGALGAGQIGAAQAIGQGLQGIGNAGFLYSLTRPSGGAPGTSITGSGMTAPPGFSFGQGGGVDYSLAPSDIRLKKNIVKVGERPDGLNVYEFDYIWGGDRQRGLMAQEVIKVYPDAVQMHNGFLHVNYSKV